MNRLVTYLGIILKWRRLIFYNTLIITALVLIIAFILPRGYTSTAQLLPPTDEGDIFGLTSILGTGMGGLSKLRISGLGGASTASDLLAGIVLSRTVMDRVAEKCSIAYYYRIKPTRPDLVRKQLKEMTGVVVGDEGIVRITVAAKTPNLSAKIANTYIAELDTFLRTSNISRGRNMRLFLEKRLIEVESTLAVAQESLKSFQARHKVVAVDEELKAAIDAYARLKSQAYLKQAELEALRDVASPDNPYYLNLQREAAAFADQLRRLEAGGGKGFGVGFAVAFANLPDVGAEFARRYRDYKIQEETYLMLCQQYEYAKVLEARDAPTITVLDYAVPPQRHTYPKRVKMTLAAFVFSLLAGVAFAYIAEYFGYLRLNKPEEYRRWLALWTEIKNIFPGRKK